ncbi:heparan-alpha-glucosaminide N-acetyltransferase domain-containing protein [Nocardioides coralli]|uniref:heparan-alpha-glucosaminide N-acetyltransferase domain-containing protein n=1 Tax=Nocardioides coralli TaxID=2872154 RepID=UPI001CA3A4F4|nr:heparan-alpha-glucosaminide N-acetyltransferase domain-containing protein [Nocardioides coralli]QZY29988.1 DUF1624 domain-containing protein [Nocardioides coralli]
MAATSRRLVGLDVARALALLGMVATHVLAPRTPAGDLAWPQAVAGGRAAALFAVLAGVSLALASGRTRPVRGRERWAATTGLAVRAVLIAVLGLALGGLESGIAIILTYYGVLFLLGLPFLGLGARGLAVLAAAWLVAAPVVSHWVRPELPERRFGSPSLEQLEQPTLLVSELLLTGYYPVLPWLAYLFAGMALGRSDLGRRKVQAAVAGGGLLLAVTSSWLSGVLVEGRLGEETLERAAFGLFGNTPAGEGWEWLLVVSPHSSTPFDLAHTIGTSLLVIAVALLLVGVLPVGWRRPVAVWFGAGTMTLTLYSLHVVMKTDAVWPPEEPGSMGYHVLVLGLVGAVFTFFGWRGPLEWLVGLPTRLLRRLAGNRPTTATVA